MPPVASSNHEHCRMPSFETMVNKRNLLTLTMALSKAFVSICSSNISIQFVGAATHKHTFPTVWCNPGKMLRSMASWVQLWKKLWNGWVREWDMQFHFVLQRFGRKKNRMEDAECRRLWPDPKPSMVKKLRGEIQLKKTQATKRWDDTRAKFADNTDDAFVPSFWLTSLKISKPGLHSATRLQILKCWQQISWWCFVVPCVLHKPAD